MIKILSPSQIRNADQYTIAHEPILSIDLMERAAHAFVSKFLEIVPERKKVRIFCGTGNNGGDGLAVGRMLRQKGWEVLTYVIGDPRNGSADFKINLDRSDLYAVIKSDGDLPEIASDDVIIDAMFGSGLSRPLEGIHKQVVAYVNTSNSTKVSIDIASGLYPDRPVAKDSTVFRPNHTISFQLPKLVFFLPESEVHVGEWHIVNIDLDPFFLEREVSIYGLTEHKDVASFIPKRSKFSHKNEVGRLMVIAGSKGKMGAAVLCARSSFKVGVGLVNLCSPYCGTAILQISIPEAMVVEVEGEDFIANIPKTEDTIAIGPGLGIHAKTVAAFENLLKRVDTPMVIDADAINILAKKKSLLKHVPKNSILTPHPGEFKRLAGAWENDFEKLEKLRNLSIRHKLNVVLKGAYSIISDTQGNLSFNPTGNPSLATAGSGDVLTGMIGGFLAQGVEPLGALRLAVYLHGLAGDLAVEDQKNSIMASDVIDKIPTAMNSLLSS